MRGIRPDGMRAERLVARAATKAVNGVTNATLTVTAAVAGSAGSLLTVAAVSGAPTLDVALAAAQSGNAITVTLGTDGAGALDDTKNTGTLVAAVIDGLASVACTTSGSGAGIVAPFGAVGLTGGHDVWSPAALAKAAGFTVEAIHALESGGNCEVHEADRLASALGITRAVLGAAL